VSREDGVRNLLGWSGLLVLALVAGGAVMVLELAAPRLTAPFVGTTALTWTVVIGTFLLGIAVGNALGGRLVDRDVPGALPVLFVLAAATAATTPWLYDAVRSLMGGWPHGLRVALGVPLTFLPAALVLGTLAPAVARHLLRLDARGRPGRRLGAIAAAGAAGSVAGTMLAGFVLVPELGTRAIFGGTALLLVAAAALAGGTLPFTRRRTPAPRPPEERAPPGGWTALAALAGAAILAVEIAAGRIVSDRLGASVYTWTSVIGVVLTGLTIGAWIGGMLADRYAPRPLLRLLLVVAAILVTYGLWGGAVLEVAEEHATEFEWDWAWTTFLGTAVAFLLPSIALGSLSPVIIRAALADPRADGRIVGGLYAAGTLGAVGATLCVGFWVLPWLGTERLLLLVAFLLAAASGVIRGRQPYALHAALVLLALAAHLDVDPAPQVGRWLRIRERSAAFHVEDSRYYRIRVRPTEKTRWVKLEEEPRIEKLRSSPLLEHAWWDSTRGRLEWDGEMSIPQQALLRTIARTRADQRAVQHLRQLTKHDQRFLQLDRLIHGYVDLQEPGWLGYEYEELYAAIVQRHAPERRQVRALFLGGGAFAFQRYLLAQDYREFSCTTVEIDPRVVRTAYDHLGLEPDPRLRIVIDDARNFVDGPAADEPPYDFVFGDAFNDLAVPFHLTTREFAQTLARRMTPDGVYLLNVIDSYDSGLFLGAMLGTLGEVFDHVRLLSLTPRHDETRDTFVIAASNAPLHVTDLTVGPGEFQSVILYDAVDVADLRARVDGLVLTDDHAPVETLLAPVVRDR